MPLYSGNNSYEKNTSVKKSIENSNNNKLSNDSFWKLKETVVDLYEYIDEINKKGVSTNFIDETFNAEEYQQKLDEELSKYTKTNERVAAAAKFLATELPKLPYFWGGGHDLSLQNFNGIDDLWGKYTAVKMDGSTDQPVGSLWKNSLDCSSFITWALVNGGFDVSKYTNECFTSTTLYRLGQKLNEVEPTKQHITSITNENIFNTVELGDVGYMKGHVGIVVDLDAKDKEITFAHVSGSGNGINLTIISTKTGLITKDDIGANKDYTNNTIDPNARIGREYFTDIISIPYE